MLQRVDLRLYLSLDDDVSFELDDVPSFDVPNTDDDADACSVLFFFDGSGFDSPFEERISEVLGGGHSEELDAKFACDFLARNL